MLRLLQNSIFSIRNESLLGNILLHYTVIANFANLAQHGNLQKASVIAGESFTTPERGNPLLYLVIAGESFTTPKRGNPLLRTEVH